MRNDQPASEAGSTRAVSERPNPGYQATLDRMAGYVKDPLLMLPLEWRPPVYGFWLRWGHLIRENLPTLCVRVNDYRASGLKCAELKTIFGMINAGEASKSVLYASELYGSLAALVGEAVKLRRAVAKNQADRDQAEEAKKATANLAESFTERFRCGG